MSVKLLTEHHLEFLSIKGGCKGSSESALVKLPHCLESHVKAHILFDFINLTQVHNFTVSAQNIFTFRQLSVFTVRFTGILQD